MTVGSCDRALKGEMVEPGWLLAPAEGVIYCVTADPKAEVSDCISVCVHATWVSGET